MATFAELCTDVKLYLHRKDVNIDELIKSEINQAVQWALQNYDFLYAEGLTRMTYPAGTLFANLEDACEDDISRLKSVQVLSNIEATSGFVIPIVDYDSIQNERLMADQANQDYTYIKGNPVVAFLCSNGFGIYPKSTSDTCLLLHYTKKLPRLVEDSDTNFVLEYGREFVLNKVLSNMLTFLARDDRQELITQRRNESWATFTNWDSRIRSTTSYD